MEHFIFDRERIPWEKLLRDAQAGDKKAMERFCFCAEPIIRTFFRVHVLERRLGRDEIRGIAWLALMKFIAGFKGEVAEETFPNLLYKVIRCALISETRKERERFENEVPDSAAGSEAGKEEETGYGRPLPASRETEPEQALLLAELEQEVQEALTHTSPRQRDCIRALYFDGKTPTEYARETGCTPQFISRTKTRTLNRMRRLLKKRNVV
jgi:RNA polymerase sigma factor (sigma-70 family)